MEFKLVGEEKNSARIEVTDPEDTILNLLVSELLKSADVAEASYYVGHPHLDKPVLMVKTKRSKPQAALKKAAEDLAGQYGDLRKLLEKELK
jgi:DNA-directed RNA polymerase subunit L